ncbi:MAG: HPr(Ser) kinase/phosphatase [Erysipelotrichaceae bacterium]|nr:HPr(Ser) kinase/phosphatase [Erysipelotrichaceae bacterium]MCI9312378.1 HPr(Ser) kinase/phosphatase [Erysipelotrichaceae bacterium]
MEEVKFITVRKLKEYFNFEQICGNEESLERPIMIADTNRPGLELAGYFDHSQLKRLVVLGDKEIAYIQTMSEHKQRKSFDFLTTAVTPAIIISKQYECPPLLKRIAKRKKFPIFVSSATTSRLIIDIVAFLDEQLAASDTLHGGLINIYGKGVLIRGESGMGKSEIALELVKRGHLLVADDRVDIYRIHNKIVGQPPEMLRGMLEIRGIGVINIQRMFGIASIVSKAEVALEICLMPWERNADYDRVGIENKKYDNLLGVEVPKIVIPVREGRSMAVIIESAVTNFILSEMGMDSAKEFEERVLQYIEENKRKEAALPTKQANTKKP